MRLRLPVLVPVLALAAALVWAVLTAQVPEDSLARAAADALAHAGIDHPTTAVLLSFRSYDTLLEVAVLLVAILGARAACPPRTLHEPGAADRVQTALVSVIAPGAVLIAGYLLWAGAYQPGGAFQAGAVLGAAGVMMHLSGMLNVSLESAPWRVGFTLGLAVFLAVGAAAVPTGAAWLQFPQGTAYLAVLTIEVGLSVSIALTLYALFAIGLAADDPAPGRPQTMEPQ